MWRRRVIRVHRRVGNSSYRHRGVRREADEHHRNDEHHAIEEAVAPTVREHNSHTQEREQHKEEGHHTTVYGHTEAIYREGIDRSTERHGIWYDYAIYNAKDKQRYHQRSTHTEHIAPRCTTLIAAEEPYHHQRRDGEQVEDMHTYREAH